MVVPWQIAIGHIITECTTRQAILINAINIADLSYVSLNDLAALFKAIKDLSDEHTAAKQLAGIGQYLADNWANLIDCEREELQNPNLNLKEAQS